VLVFMPTGNANLFIMRTAFKGEEDASMNVRLTNQELIQPYIRSFPFGSGVGSTGGWGTKFSPYTFIGKFPPDSEYVRIAIELGWIGLLYFCILLFFILKMGIDYYFKTKDPTIKSYYASILTVTFMTVVAMYPQEAIRIHPTGILFATCMALLAKMHSVQNFK
jgi:putative inorganic carbon (hco3(-)) transporter